MPFPKKKKPTGMTGGKPRKSLNSVLPAWLIAIPESQSHGSGTLQKRLWKVTSDCVRIRDWTRYGKCVATGKKIERWQDGQAGHFIPFSKCNGMFKFDMDNIHMQGAQSNAWGSMDDWIEYEKEMGKRGISSANLRAVNKSHAGKSMQSWAVVQQISKVLKEIGSLPIQPDYYERVMQLKNVIHTDGSPNDDGSV